MKTAILTIVVSLAAVLAFFAALGGCNEKQLRKIDQVVADANAAAQVPRIVADTPAGQALIPPQVRIYLELLGFGGAMAFGIWQKIRASKILEKKQDVDVTLQAIADAIDRIDPVQAEPVKAEIKQVMRDREILSIANPIVDEHRSKLTS